LDFSRNTKSLELVAHLLSHEVKNPLVAIKTFTQLLKDRFDDPDFRSSFYEIVGANVERIDSLIEAASTFSRLGPPNLTAVDVNAMIEHILKDFELALLRKRILVLPECVESLPFARADREHLVYALRSLIARAVDLTREGTDLRLTSNLVTSSKGRRRWLETTIRFANQEAGMVMLPRVLAEGAEAFPQPGSLEVALAQDLVERQGGCLNIEVCGENDTLVTLDVPTI
jgi:signal transduction histidine kinase